MGWGERWEGASKGMGYMYTHGYIMLRFDRKQQNSFFSCLFIYVFYFTILYWFCHTVTWSCHGCTCVPHPESLSHLLPHPIPLGHSSAPAPSTLYHASNLDWRFVSQLKSIPEGHIQEQGIILLATKLFKISNLPSTPMKTSSKIKPFNENLSLSIPLSKRSCWRYLWWTTLQLFSNRKHTPQDKPVDKEV